MDENKIGKRTVQVNLIEDEIYIEAIAKYILEKLKLEKQNKKALPNQPKSRVRSKCNY